MAHRNIYEENKGQVIIEKTAAEVRALIARNFCVCEDDLIAPTRKCAQTAFARQVAMYLCHVQCHMSLTRVAKLFGRDRTTVAHACHLVEDKRDDTLFDEMLCRMEATLANVPAQKSEPFFFEGRLVRGAIPPVCENALRIPCMLKTLN